MILSKRRFSLAVTACLVFPFGLLITQRFLGRSFVARMRDKDIIDKDMTLETSAGIESRAADEERVPSLMGGYRNSKLYRPSRRNVSRSENGQKVFADVSKNRVKNIKHVKRQRFPLPPKDAELNMAWFSITGTFWQKAHYPVMYPCVTGKVILNKADKDIKKIRKADVVLFAGELEDENLWKKLRDRRDPSQIWLFITDESPLVAKGYIPPYHLRDITFNVTFTYRSNADISVSYGYYERNETPLSFPPGGSAINFHKQSPKLAAWMSSHCDTVAWNRTGFIWDLSRHIAIDRYGSCGDLRCRKVERYKQGLIVNNQCKKTLRQYKFLFALQNSCCAEYISEGFWNILRHYDAIPVVVGPPKEDYERIAPPKSFIYAADFETLEELAEYIERVATDEELFNSFFKWKYEGYVRVIHEKQRGISHTAANCRILEYLQRPNRTHQQHDLYGPAWMGGCSKCDDSSLLKGYGHMHSGYT